MKPVQFVKTSMLQAVAQQSTQSDAAARKSPVTRFGEAIDVRHRGVMKLGRFAGTQTQSNEAPAVVRLWSDRQCRELTAHEARTLAEQLLAAASLAESQNRH